MLWLKTEAVAELISPAAFAGDAAIEEIAGVKLRGRFGRPDFHRAASRRFADTSGQRKLVGFFVEHPVVVVAVAENKPLVVRVVDAGANGRRLEKIKRGSGHRTQFAGRDQAAVHGRELVRIDRDDVVKDVAAA